MTLRELLAREPLKDLKVINKKANLDRLVSTVESTETPDVIAYIAKNSFIITTAMIYKDDQQKLSELILRLNSLPCSGLGIKIGRFLDALEQRVIDTADSVGFPLICIPMDKTLGNVYHDFLSIIWNTQNIPLVDVLSMQKKYYDLIMHGIPLRNLLSILGTAYKKHILIIARTGEVVAGYNTSRVDEQIAKALIRRIDRNSGSFVQDDFFHPQKKKEVCASLYPIRSISQYLHYMIIFESDRSAMIPPAIMRQIVMLLGVYFYKNLFANYNEIRSRNEFLNILIQSGRYGSFSPAQILKYGQEYGLIQSPHYRVMLCCFRNAETTKFNAAQMSRCEEEYITIYEYLKAKIAKICQGGIVVLPDVDNWRYAFVIQSETDVPENRMLREIREAIEDAFDRQLVFSYGNYAYDIGVISASYCEALEILDDLRDKPEEYLIRYEAKDMLELLKGFSGARINEACQKTLQKLAFPENETNRELRQTLQTYLNCRCSVIETANRLYLHRNTVRYRIKKCEELLQADLSDASVCFQLQLCLFFSGDAPARKE